MGVTNVAKPQKRPSAVGQSPASASTPHPPCRDAHPALSRDATSLAGRREVCARFSAGHLGRLRTSRVDDPDAGLLQVLGDRAAAAAAVEKAVAARLLGKLVLVAELGPHAHGDEEPAACEGGGVPRHRGGAAGGLSRIGARTPEEPGQGARRHVSGEGGRRVPRRDHLLDLADGAGRAAAHEAARARVAAAVPRADGPLSLLRCGMKRRDDRLRAPPDAPRAE